MHICSSRGEERDRVTEHFHVRTCTRGPQKRSKHLVHSFLPRKSKYSTHQVQSSNLSCTRHAAEPSKVSRQEVGHGERPSANLCGDESARNWHSHARHGEFLIPEDEAHLSACELLQKGGVRGRGSLAGRKEGSRAVGRDRSGHLDIGGLPPVMPLVVLPSIKRMDPR